MGYRVTAPALRIDTPGLSNAHLNASKNKTHDRKRTGQVLVLFFEALTSVMMTLNQLAQQQVLLSKMGSLRARHVGQKELC